MKALAGAALVLVLAACQSKPDPVNGANAIFKAPKATTGSGVDPETQGPVNENETGVEPTKPAVTPESTFQFKEILADPKDFKSRIDLVRTLLGEEWLPVSKTPKGNGVILWKFMRKDAGRIDADPFGLPDLTKQPPPKTPEKKD